jgi:16S rRNA (guanine966-N2)-methyltransferase
LHVLDLFAGSGALGLEALSRGARSVTFVDSGRPALTALRANVAELGAGDAARVVASDVLTFLRKRPVPARWAFVDPPYRSDLAVQALELLGESLSADGVAVVEHDRRNAPLDRHGSLIRTDSRRYGDTVIAFYRQGPPSP